MEPLIATFHIDWKIIIAQAVNFAVVFVVLYVYALKPLSKLMEERSQKIAKGMNDAKENAELLTKSKQEYDLALAKARKEAQAIFDATKKEAESKREEMLNQAKVEVEKMISSGKQTLEAEKSKMVAEAKKEVIDLVVAVNQKLTGAHDPALAEKTLKELSNI